MTSHVFHKACLFPICMAALVCFSTTTFADDAVDYSRDIRPLLSNNCYHCHGPNEQDREGGFRLDQLESTLAEADSGEHPIVPGNLEKSEIIRRIMSTDPDEMMPPPESNKSLKPKEIEKIKQWVTEGAKWRDHWAYIPLEKSEVPTAIDANWGINPIDNFIAQRLDQSGLTPAAPANKTRLIRRITFDLTGLPATLAEVDAFLKDDSPTAYEKVVDRLLQSNHYGEHMARFWLDAARYGDTHGLHLDNYREMWLYRDWVVNAFNSNMPYDQFTTEQLAGDLIPDATEDQIIATGFNRCHVTTSEGGSIAEEVYVRNVVDRVVTTGTVFMGVSFECSRCHDHKYDPFTMNDFYSMFAYFNSMDGNPLDKNIKDPAPIYRQIPQAGRDEIAKLKTETETAQQAIKDYLAKIEYVEPEESTDAIANEPTEVVWIDDGLPEGAKGEGNSPWEWTEEKELVYSGSQASTRTATGLSQHFFTGAKTPLVIYEGDKLFTYVYLDPKNPPKEIMLQWNDGNWNHRAYWGGNLIDWGTDNSASRKRKGDLPELGKWVRLEVPASEVGLKVGAKINGWAFTQFDGTVYWDKAGIVTREGRPKEYRSLKSWIAEVKKSKPASIPKNISELIKKADDKQTEADLKKITSYFVENIFQDTKETFTPLQKTIKKNNERTAQITKASPTTLIFKETAEPKEAFILTRGEYDQKGDAVTRSTPESLLSFPEGAPNNRLGLAQWLLDPKHPLTSRVAVNRFWQQFFGTGIVKTSEDFGSQGEVPSHPELLDWMSKQFIDSDWDIKATMKQIAMSATYRQSSDITPELYKLDPENRLLARGPRYRLDAEMIRDQALHVSGLLSSSLGGPSVKPPQPDGLWLAVGYSGSNTVRFKPDTGSEKVHRRTLYTFIKRTSPPPQMTTFDAPSREACIVRRERTNTPMQALLLMNDPQYIESARGLGQRAILEGGEDTASRIDFIFRTCTARHPTTSEADELTQLLKDNRTTFEKNPEAATKLISIGESVANKDINPAELAAWTMLGNLMLNLDEVVSKN
ncbi:MAG: hypothetical protein COA78_19595 [Blastopirellula sp.]|nr:MAG: hypothetical protein COA78_19595 [Blastopirellula sp.]